MADGMAATDMVLRLIKQGGHVVADNDVYGKTIRRIDYFIFRAVFQNNFQTSTDDHMYRSPASPA